MRRRIAFPKRFARNKKRGLQKLLECNESSRRFGSSVAALCERRNIATPNIGGRRPPLQSSQSNRKFLSSVGKLRRWQSRDEVCDRLEDSLIHIVLRFARCVELAFRHAQGMVAAFDHTQKIWRFHLGPDAL